MTSTRRVIKRQKGQAPTTKRELTENEKKGQEALRRVREQMPEKKGEETPKKATMQSEATLKQAPAPQKSSAPQRAKLEGLAEGGSSQSESDGNAVYTTKKQAQLPETTQPNTTKPTLKKKEKFEDTHERMTTYFSKENHRKLKEVRVNYGIPITESINKALEEYFEKYSL